MCKNDIILSLEEMKLQLESAFPVDAPFELSRLAALSEEKDIDGKRFRVWTKALQAALDAHSVVRIDPSPETYYIDGPVYMPSGRRILARGARIQLTPGCRTVLLRNIHVTDGSNHPEDSCVPADENLSVEGGVWAESRDGRLGYGNSGCADADNSLPGVSTCMLFSNVKDLHLKDMEFVNTAGFSVQIGAARNVVTENLHFVRCFADGVHLNGNLENVLVRNSYGYVGDDLVALNPYDWDNSGINFGPARRVFIDGVFSDPDSPYKAIRLQPGVYVYPEGGESHCRIDDLVLRRVKGIKSFKLYLQTPPYRDVPDHPARVGSCGSLYFEDMDIDLNGQIDAGLYEGVRHSAGYNIFGAFEILADIEQAEFENIRLTLYRDTLPESCLVSVGPKSMTGGNLYEVFDPYASCRVKRLRFSGITVNGLPATSPRDLIRVIRMQPNPDFPRTFPRGGNGRGQVEEVEIQ